MKPLVPLFVVGVVGCAVEPLMESTAGITFEEFETRTARVPGTGAYVVDWDRVIRTKDELRTFYDQLQQGALAIRTSDGLDARWNETQQRDLTYCVSNAFGVNKAAVIEAVRQASDDGWEKLANVNFRYVPMFDATCTPQNLNVVFDIGPVSDAPYTASAFYPNEPRQDRSLTIDVTDAFQLSGFTTLHGLLAHELGHALGFVHEHVRPEAQSQVSGCTGSGELRGLTSYDSASIMHYPKCNGTATTMWFTQRDREGAALVYGAPLTNGAPIAQLTSPADGAIVGPSFTVEAQVVDQDLAKTVLAIDGAIYATSTAAPFMFVVTDLAEGAHTLQIEATDHIGQVGTQTITITVARDSGTGSDDDDGEADHTAGCNASGAQASLALALGLLVAGVSRRRRRAPAGTV